MTSPIILSGNIESQIQAALEALLTNTLQTAIPTDPLVMQTIRAWPLQDDPTTVAPFIAVGMNPTNTRIPDRRMLQIGGPLYAYIRWRARFGSPRTETREDSVAQIAELGRRIERVLRKNCDLAGILSDGALTSTAGDVIVTGNAPHLLIEHTDLHIFGGDNEYYGEGMCYWSYLVEEWWNL